MEIARGFFKWFISGIDNIIIALNLPTNGINRFFVGGLIVLILILVIIIAKELIWDLVRGIRKFLLKTKPEESPKKIKKDNGSIKKRADLVYYQVNPPLAGTLKWERTGKGIRGICLANKRQSLQESEKLQLLLNVNGGWFILKNSTQLVDHKIEMFKEAFKETKKRGDLDFKWLDLPMKILSGTGQYEVLVSGHYPHLGQSEKRVFLFLAELKEVEETEGFEDRIYLFEDTELIGGIAWQGKKIYRWKGKRANEEEVAEIEDQYLEREVNGIEPNFGDMTT